MAVIKAVSSKAGIGQLIRGEMALGERRARPLRGCESTLFSYPRIGKRESRETSLACYRAWSEGILRDEV